ncbi:MAG: elongation factor G [Rhizobiaceae bacterium]
MADGNGRVGGPRCIALVGPFASGKTTLLEAILARTGAIDKQQATGNGQTVGDASPEAKSHQMSIEATAAVTNFMGEEIAFIDCPGSVEFAQEADAILSVCDAAIVVTEPDAAKIPALQLIFQKLDERGIPRMLFLNKIDKAELGVRDTLQLLQPVSTQPLLLRQIPLRQDGIIVGSIDLALERAYVYREHAESEVTEIPSDEMAREVEARFSMLETLADHDDALMEELLEDIEPPRDQVFDDLSADLRAGHVTPVLIGTADKSNGVLRLLKVIRHDCPGLEDTVERLGFEKSDAPIAVVAKTIHTTHGGKQSVVRVLNGSLKDGSDLIGQDDKSQRISGISKPVGKTMNSVSNAESGETVVLGKLENAVTGEWLSGGKDAVSDALGVDKGAPVYSISLQPKNRKDDVKLSAALRKLVEEDPSLQVIHDADNGEIVLAGQGEMHMRVSIERLEGKYQIPVEHGQPRIPYRETIRKGTTQRGRHKKQSGGHGQYGDVVLEIRPLSRGEGFQFTDTITGGVVPKQYIPSVETGIREFLKSGPLGFPLVDLAVNLSDGSYHNVDSSDMAFQMAGKLAMREAMGACSPVLLEPIMKVTIYTPSESTAKITALIPQRRGRILGYDARPGWNGWDQVESLIPMADLGDLIIELRSATAGTASYASEFDHMAELTGRGAEAVLAENSRSNAA